MSAAAAASVSGADDRDRALGAEDGIGGGHSDHFETAFRAPPLHNISDEARSEDVFRAQRRSLRGDRRREKDAAPVPQERIANDGNLAGRF